MRMENKSLAEKYVRVRNELADLRQVHEAQEKNYREEIRERLRKAEQAERLEGILMDLSRRLTSEQDEHQRRERELQQKGEVIEEMREQVNGERRRAG